MKYQKLTDREKAIHPSIHYTGSVRGMKKLGYWGENWCMCKMWRLHI